MSWFSAGHCFAKPGGCYGENSTTFIRIDLRACRGGAFNSVCHGL
jgi:hypothetical protein